MQRLIFYLNLNQNVLQMYIFLKHDNKTGSLESWLLLKLAVYHRTSVGLKMSVGAQTGDCQHCFLKPANVAEKLH